MCNLDIFSYKFEGKRKMITLTNQTGSEHVKFWTFGQVFFCQNDATKMYRKIREEKKYFFKTLVSGCCMIVVVVSLDQILFIKFRVS